MLLVHQVNQFLSLSFSQPMMVPDILVNIDLMLLVDIFEPDRELLDHFLNEVKVYRIDQEEDRLSVLC